MQLYSPAALCPPLLEIANGMISYSPDNTPDYIIGTVATYSCNQGYSLVDGFTTKVCKEVGRSPAMFDGSTPICERKQGSACMHVQYIYSTLVNAALFSHSTMPSSARVSQWNDLLL